MIQLTRREVAGDTAERSSSSTFAEAQPLSAELRRRVEGEVRFGAGDRALYATDASNYRQVPIGVVIPRSVEDVVETVAVCREFGAPVLARGGGTSLAGQCCNFAVVLDMSKYVNRVLQIDGDDRSAWVEPGTNLDTLRDAAREHGLTFGPDPATHRWCTLGGMIGNNSCGIHSVMARFYGPGPRTEHQVEELDVLTYDGLRMRVGQTNDDELDRIVREGGRRGAIYDKLRDLRDQAGPAIRERYSDLPRRVSGYNLDQLLPENGFHVARALVGSESTCAMILGAKLRLIPNPPRRALLILGYPSVYDAGDAVADLLSLKPVGLEGMDARLVEYLRKSHLHEDTIDELFPGAGGWLLVEFGGETQAEADERAQQAIQSLRRREEPPSMKLHSDPEAQQHAWEIRESGLAATAWVPDEDDTWPGWEDSAVPPEVLGDYLRGLRQLLEKYRYSAALYGHFGDGCIHTRINFELQSSAGVARYRAFIDEAADLVLGFGGSFSGEHGDGQARGELLPKMFGEPLMQAFREFKAIWDPDWKMNPGKLVDARPFTSDLRIGGGTPEAPTDTHFRFPSENGSFARAALRCVGVGKCRKLDSGTMCPSFMVLREEKHTTRGRAHLLFEMLRGDPLDGGWRDSRVKESLDLCLSCKGCKGECPVDVDVATYKAEFLSHYYAGRLRPLSAYAFGYIDVWSRLASYAPGAANLLTQTPLLRDAAKLTAGIAKQRKIPPFARRSFKSSWRKRGPSPAGERDVILWPDTFNNYFHPEVAVAAAEVLEAAGCRVMVPARNLCCGRPLYEFGMLDRAKALLREIIDALRPQIRAEVPVIGAEPSCVAVFRDELPELFPDDDDARQLASQVFTLAEFLEGIEYRPPQLQASAILHGHCHDKAIMGFKSEPRLLEGMLDEVNVLDSGCCGMAGAFGFEKHGYDVSVGAGERVLLPAVRNAAPDALIVADGFSCREQIRQLTDRTALHAAQVIQLALGARDADGAESRAAARARGTTQPRENR